MPRLRMSITERFWKKVSKSTKCWIWTGTLRPNGYGKLTGALDNGLPDHVHRLSWILHFGAIPQGMCVCHRCDNRRCVRPGHLFIGNYSDNMLDAFDKGRAKNWPGAKSPNAKLTQRQADKIRTLYANGKHTRIIADMYSVSDRTIRNIVIYDGYQP